jgi:hypothetical protein
MKRLVVAVFLAAGFLAGCGEGAKLPIRHEEAIEAAPVPAAPPKVEITQTAADDACRLFIKALYTGSEATASETCMATVNGDAVAMSTTHGRSLPANNAVAGEVFMPAAELMWHRAKMVDAKGAWENAGAVFVTTSAEPLCLDIAAFAPDATSDSLFVLRATDQEPEIVPIPIDPEAELSVSVAGPVSPGGKAAAFAVYAREPRTLIKSLSFRTCP